MNKLKHILLLIAISFFALACNPSLEYKYLDMPQIVDCPGADAQLMNEALYSFYDDITQYYRAKDMPNSEGMSTLQAYANFIYTGALGEADYGGIISDHSREIIKQLEKEKQLWNIGGTYSNLDHSSEFVSCLFSKMTNEELKTTILSLQQINSVSPKMLAERFRLRTRDAMEDPNYAMYIALDTYYQYLIDIKP